MFATSRCRTNASKRSQLYGILNSYNNLFNALDVVATSFRICKKLVLQYLG